MNPIFFNLDIFLYPFPDYPDIKRPWDDLNDDEDDN